MPLAFVQSGAPSVVKRRSPMIVLAWAGARSSLIFTNVKLRRPNRIGSLPSNGPPRCPYIGVGGRNPQPGFQIGVLRMVKSIESSTGPMHTVVKFFMAGDAHHSVGNGNICWFKPTVCPVGNVHH